MSTNTIDVEEDITPIIREMLDGFAERFAGEPLLRPVILAVLIREAMDRLSPRERCRVLDTLTAQHGRYVQ